MSGRRATTAKLDPGEHTIDRGNPRERNGTWRLDWSLSLYDGTVVRHTTTGKDVSVVKRRARARAEQLLADSGPTSARLHALAAEIAALSPQQRSELEELVRDLIT
jgi:hypothetical protein